jgi:competence protein ComEA
MKKRISFSLFLVVALVFVATVKVACSAATEAGKQAAEQAAVQEGKINVNTADAAQLESLPGIGPATAKSILDHREQHGAFKSTEELKDVKGIGDKKYDAIKDLVTVE